MLSRCVLTIACVAALLSGCRTAPHVNAHIESVNAEYRELENRLYVAEDENRRLQADLARAQEENRRLRGESSGRSIRGGRSSGPAIDGSFDLSPPEIEMGSDTGPSIDVPGIPSVSSPPVPRSPSTDGVPRRSNRENLDLPLIETPEGDDAPATKPRSDKSAPESLPKPQIYDTHQPDPGPSDDRVTQIFLNPLLTGGDDLDSEPGDDGLSVLVEPRNKSNQFVPQPGRVSVVVLDPSKQGDAARVARWDFDPTATREKLQRVSSARGIHLRLPWPADPPKTNKLQLFVRYETADGRKLQAEREINITLPGQYSHRWTPRPPDRPRRTPEQLAKQTETAHQPQPTPAAEPTPAAPSTTAQAPAQSPTPATTAASNAPADKSAAPTQAKRNVPTWSPYR